MKANILLVEDNPDILRINERLLETEGYDVSTAETLVQANTAIFNRMPAAILLDIMLPDGSGLDWCRRLREENHIDVPVLFLTALGEKEDVLTGLKAGGDDYIAKPYDMDILLGRLEALLRRSVRQREPVPFGPFTIDYTSQRVMNGQGKDCLLKPKEFAVLALLIAREGDFCSSEFIYETVWRSDINSDLRTLYVHISGLRSKLELQAGSAVQIEHKRGVGYRIFRRYHG